MRFLAHPQVSPASTRLERTEEAVDAVAMEGALAAEMATVVREASVANAAATAEEKVASVPPARVERGRVGRNRHSPFQFHIWWRLHLPAALQSSHSDEISCCRLWPLNNRLHTCRCSQTWQAKMYFPRMR